MIFMMVFLVTFLFQVFIAPIPLAIPWSVLLGRFLALRRTVVIHVTLERLYQWIDNHVTPALLVLNAVAQRKYKKYREACSSYT